jgi:tritrans,polycis-undecaprenyl-diphosphate synthase [geranylgeranyl-diphosphate specific]
LTNPQDSHGPVSNLAYRQYEKRLLAEIQASEVPKHVAVIMDGNRRFAESLGLNPMDGHMYGRDKLEELLNWCLELNIRILTVYAFSTENLRRAPEEVQMLMGMFEENFRKLADDPRVAQHGIRLKVIGQLNLLEPKVQDAIAYAMEKTKNNSNYLLNLAVAYGGRDEIMNAVRKIASEAKEGTIQPEDVTEEIFSKHLYTNGIPDPDLILRTSGEERISNFLLWQLAYSELYFADVYWPGMRKIDFLRAIRSYQQRHRRMGA